MTNMTLSDGTTITLSEDQQAARAAILTALFDHNEREAVLSGPAGSGKTTLMRALLADCRERGCAVILLAPTGKAARRLAEVTGEDTSTIHRPLYGQVAAKLKATKAEQAAYDKAVQAAREGGKPVADFRAWLRDKRAAERRDIDEELLFSEPQQVGHAGTVIVIDEASMVGSRLAGDLRRHVPKGATLLWVGDREQLPPVRDTWGCRFDQPTGLLEQVHRQAQDSPIIQMATAIRQGRDFHRLDFDDPVYRDHATVAQIARWLAKQHEAGTDHVVLTFTNRKRNLVNDAVRSCLGVSHEPLTVGERVLVTSNHHPTGLCNGEVRIVSALRVRETVFGSKVHELCLVGVQRGGKPRWLPYCPKSLQAGQKPAARQALAIDYGYCLSIHKSQGSQWHTVGVIHDGPCWGMLKREPDTYRRLIYTAVTRAAERLLIFDQ